MTPVAITGLGVVSALGTGVAPFWEGLVAGRSGVAPIARFPVPAGTLGAEVPVLDARTFVRSPVGRRIDRLSLLALAACRLALVDAGLGPEAIDPTRTGLGIGTALGNLSETGPFLERVHAGRSANPLVFPNMVMNAALSYASIELGVTGPSALLTEQEASGEAAIAWGAQLVASGAVDVCLAGAADELAPLRHQVLHEAGLLPRTPGRPFDPAADGAVPGEGAAVLVLESLAHARARGVRVYARLAPHPGFGVPAPVHGWPRDPAPIADGLRALAADVDAVVAAASGTPEVDGVEAAALVRAFAGRAVAVTAPRGAIGDFGAAGALGVATAALMVAHGVVPPTVGATVAPPGLDVVVGSARRLSVRTVLVNGLARGGACRPLRVAAVA